MVTLVVGIQFVFRLEVCDSELEWEQEWSVSFTSSLGIILKIKLQCP